MAGELLLSPASETPVRYEPQEAGGGGEEGRAEWFVSEQRETIFSDHCGNEGSERRSFPSFISLYWSAERCGDQQNDLPDLVGQGLVFIKSKISQY